MRQVPLVAMLVGLLGFVGAALIGIAAIATPFVGAAMHERVQLSVLGGLVYGALGTAGLLLIAGFKFFHSKALLRGRPWSRWYLVAMNTLALGAWFIAGNEVTWVGLAWSTFIIAYFGFSKGVRAAYR